MTRLRILGLFAMAVSGLLAMTYRSADTSLRALAPFDDTTCDYRDMERTRGSSRFSGTIAFVIGLVLLVL